MFVCSASVDFFVKKCGSAEYSPPPDSDKPRVCLSTCVMHVLMGLSVPCASCNLKPLAVVTLSRRLTFDLMQNDGLSTVVRIARCQQCSRSQGAAIPTPSVFGQCVRSRTSVFFFLVTL